MTLPIITSPKRQGQGQGQGGSLNLNLNPIAAITETSKTTLGVFSNSKYWAFGGSLLSCCLPWVVNLTTKFQLFQFPNRRTRVAEQKKNKTAAVALTGCSVPLFRPYVAKVPWHKGARAFLSQLFPRYGHYCGPNWSSGKENGSLLWDQRPVDWLDFCCYCHDIGYDTHDQSKLLRADLTFLDCLERERPHLTTTQPLAHFYKTIYIAGLRNVLIPYRKHLVKLQEGQPVIEHSNRQNVQKDL